MKFLSVGISNFMALESAQLKLDDRGLVLVQGENKGDPSATSNGAGKSSIADAICWCLWATTARDEKGDAVVNRFRKGGTSVILEIESDGRLYRIERYRKHKTEKSKLRVFIDNEASGAPFADETELTKGTDAETQRVVERIVGCTADVFNAAVYAGQEKMPDIPKMTDKEIKGLIEQAAGIETLNKAYEIALSQVRVATAEFEDLRDKVERRRERVSDLDDQIAEAEAEKDDWEAQRQGRLKAEKKKARDKLLEAKMIDADAVAKKRAAAEKARDKAQKEIDGVSAEIEEERRLSAEASKTDRIEAAAKDHVCDIQKELARAERRLETVGDQVGEPCSECGKPHTEDDVEPLRIRAREQVAVAKDNLAEATKELEKASQSAERARNALKSYRDSMTDTAQASELVKRHSDEIHRFDEMLRDRKTMLSEARRFKERCEEIAAEENPHVGAIRRAGVRREESQADLEKHEKALTVAKRTLAVKEQIAKVYGPAGVRAHILDTVTPFLNERTSTYLTVLSDGNITALWSTISKTAKGELRDKFKIEVANSNGASTFGGLSGGEKRKVRVACALALQDLVASRASKPIDLWIGDEIDDALDPAGLERLMQILEGKARERGTVLVVSHSDLKDWIRDVVTVVKKGPTSTVLDGVSA